MHRKHVHAILDVFQVILKFDKITQVAIVVNDLRKTMKHLWEELGVGPWKLWTLTPENTETTLHGKHVESSFRVAMAKVGEVSIELVEHLEGESTFKEFLEKKGEGLHHLKYTVQNPEEILEKFIKGGGRILQSGKIGQNSFHYLDTESKLGFILEIASGQALRTKPPDEIYPPE